MNCADELLVNAGVVGEQLQTRRRRIAVHHETAADVAVHLVRQLLVILIEWKSALADDLPDRQ